MSLMPYRTAYEWNPAAYVVEFETEFGPNGYLSNSLSPILIDDVWYKNAAEATLNSGYPLADVAAFKFDQNRDLQVKLFTTAGLTIKDRCDAENVLGKVLMEYRDARAEAYKETRGQRTTKNTLKKWS